MNFTGVPSGLTGIGKPGIESIHLRIVRLFTEKSFATSSAVISSGKLFIFITSSKRMRRLKIWRKQPPLKWKNRPIEKPYTYIIYLGVTPVQTRLYCRIWRFCVISRSGFWYTGRAGFGLSVEWHFGNASVIHGFEHTQIVTVECVLHGAEKCNIVAIFQIGLSGTPARNLTEEIRSPGVVPVSGNVAEYRWLGWYSWDRSIWLCNAIKWRGNTIALLRLVYRVLGAIPFEFGTVMMVCSSQRRG